MVMTLSSAVFSTVVQATLRYQRFAAAAFSILSNGRHATVGIVAFYNCFFFFMEAEFLHVAFATFSERQHATGGVSTSVGFRPSAWT